MAIDAKSSVTRAGLSEEQPAHEAAAFLLLSLALLTAITIALVRFNMKIVGWYRPTLIVFSVDIPVIVQANILEQKTIY